MDSSAAPWFTLSSIAGMRAQTMRLGLNPDGTVQTSSFWANGVDFVTVSMSWTTSPTLETSPEPVFPEAMATAAAFWDREC